MLKKHLNLFTLLCLCQFVFSQQSQEKFTKSLLSGDVISAIKHFEGIKNKESLKSDIHYFATLAYAKNNDFKNAFNHLSIAAKKGLSNIEIYNDGSLDTLKTLDGYNKIITLINKNKELATQELKQIHKNISYKFKNTSSNDKKVELEEIIAKTEKEEEKLKKKSEKACFLETCQ